MENKAAVMFNGKEKLCRFPTHSHPWEDRDDNWERIDNLGGAADVSQLNDLGAKPELQTAIHQPKITIKDLMPGMEVEFKTWEELEEEFGADEHGHIKTLYRFRREMWEFAGEIQVIDEIKSGYFRIKNCTYNFDPKTIRRIIDDGTQETKIIIDTKQQPAPVPQFHPGKKIRMKSMEEILKLHPMTNLNAVDTGSIHWEKMQLEKVHGEVYHVEKIDFDGDLRLLEYPGYWFYSDIFRPLAPGEICTDGVACRELTESEMWHKGTMSHYSYPFCHFCGQEIAGQDLRPFEG